MIEQIEKTVPTRPTQDVPVLAASDLVKTFMVRDGRNRVDLLAVGGVDLQVSRGETLGLVGESGCGKTTLGRMLVRLLDATSGTIRFKGRDVTRLSGRSLSAFRRNVQMVFQDPFSSLNPRMNIGAIVAEPLNVQRIGSRAERRARVAEVLEMVGIAPEQQDRLPTAFSGGQRQRISVARALALEPDLLVLDEPVSALDASIQAQLLNVLSELQQRLGLTYVFISHDLSVVRHVCDKVAVMYLGKIVEMGTTAQIFSSPAHPYTRALLSAVPRVEADRPPRIVISGDVSDLKFPANGCPFRPRCWIAQQRCEQERPALVRHDETERLAACLFAGATESTPGTVPPLRKEISQTGTGGKSDDH